MTATQKLKQLILRAAGRPVPDEPTKVDEAFRALSDTDDWADAKAEVRHGTHSTDIPCERSRHYESRSVAAQAVDGSWIGWTYWYGGGKHGEPRSVPWIEDAYDLEASEQTVTVKVFRRVDDIAKE